MSVRRPWNIGMWEELSDRSAVHEGIFMTTITIAMASLFRSRGVLALFLVMSLANLLWFLLVHIERALRFVLISYWDFWLNHFDVMCIVVAAIIALYIIRVFPNLPAYSPITYLPPDCLQCSAVRLSVPYSICSCGIGLTRTQGGEVV